VEIGRYTLENVDPVLRPGLDLRLLEMAEDAADQIGEDREGVIASVLDRFAAWITARPVARRAPAIPSHLPAAFICEPAAERRRQVMLHMGLRFSGVLSELQALAGGAIAIVWHAGPDEEYDYEPPHPARNGQVYAVRDSWALSKGLMQPSRAGFYDPHDAPGAAHYCRCHGQWLYGLRQLPPDMLTEAGGAELRRVQALFRGPGGPV